MTIDAASAHPVPARHDAAAFVARAEALCAGRGLRLTELRRSAVLALAQSQTPLGAYDLAERMSQGQRRVSPISVYRSLEFLIEIGLVHRIATRNAYVACEHAHGLDETVVFLICRSCGGVDEATSPALDRSLEVTAASNGFRPRHRIVELEGECADCQKTATTAVALA
nr:Fur family transcriptional regulator [Bosea vaviloviae]